MSRYDSGPDELSLDWPDDTIYCEASCRTEDVLYEGSEDEDYDDARVRRQRYEAAGQRYLRGNALPLLSTTLRGPFDSKTGWDNPWRSKNRTRSQANESLKTSRLHKTKRRETIPETQEPPIMDSVITHLPSPESLKQVQVNISHPFLEDDELAKVQSWRDRVPAPCATQDSFWLSKSPTKKRKAKASEWLKTATSKRRKTSVKEASSIDTFVHHQHQPSRNTLSSSKMNQDVPSRWQTSFNSAPGRIEYHKSLGHHYAAADIERDGKDAYDQDELAAATDLPGSVASRSNSPPRRTSPKRDVTIAGNLAAAESDDELSANKVAAATLSSPVSQPDIGRKSSNAPHAKTSSKQSHGSLQPQVLSPSRTSRNKKLAVKKYNEPHAHEANQSGADMSDADELLNKSNGDCVPRTQHDQSFCYKLCRETEANLSRLVDIQDQSTKQDQNPVESAPINAMQDACSDTFEPTMKMDAAEPTADNNNAVAAMGAVTGGSSGMDEHRYANPQVETVHNAASVAEIPHIVQPHDQVLISEDVVALNEVSGNCDSTVEEVMNIEGQDTDDTEKDIERGDSSSDEWDSIDDMAISNQSAVALSAPSQSCCLAKIPTKDDSNQNDAIQDAKLPAADYERNATLDSTEVPVACEQLSGDIPIEEYGLGDEGVATPHDGSSKETSEFSIRNMFQRLVPTSPWAKLSHLTSQSFSSPMREDHSENPFGIAEIQRAPFCSDEKCSPSPAQGGEESSDQYRPTVSADISIPDAPSTSDQIYSTTATEDDRLTVGKAFSGNNKLGSTTPRKAAYATISVSQQSPWIKSPLEQLAPSSANSSISQNITPLRIGLQAEGFAKTQTPGVDIVDAGHSRMPEPHDLPALQNADCSDTHAIAECDEQTSTWATPLVPRPSTPEPTFAVKSFACFMSPTPEKNRQTKRTSHRSLCDGYPGTPDDTASAVMDTYDCVQSSKRVSWGPLPGDENTTQLHHSQSEEGVLPLPKNRGRQMSPPPVTPLSELPVSEDSKFGKHFTAVVSRTDGLRQRLLPTPSQLTPLSPGPQAMAEMFVAADQVANTSSNDVNAMDLGGVEEEPAQAVESLEPMDIVDDIFRDMGDFLQAWDVDTELSKARKADLPGLSVPEMAFGSQNPW